MIRREKGHKRYAEQRERRFTEPLIREDELARVREAQERISRGRMRDAVEDKRKG
jgi:hypothetical protein